MSSPVTDWSTGIETPSAAPSAALRGLKVARYGSLAIIALAFGCWGILRALNDLVVAAAQFLRPDHDAEAMAIHISFFAAYILVPIPVAAVLRRIGLRAGVAISVGVMGAAALCCAGQIRSTASPLYLTSLALLAAGIATLQTAGNPAATLLGSPASGARRLLLVQSAMSFGAVAAPFLVEFGRHAATLDAVRIPARARLIYLVVGGVLIALTMASSLIPTLGLTSLPQSPVRVRLRPSDRYAFVAAFLFVGTEATILTHVVELRRFVSATGANFHWPVTLAGYWVFITLGRLLSSYLVRKAPSVSMLRTAALSGAALVVLAMLARGRPAVFILLLTGLVNSVVFPLIFSLSTTNSNLEELSMASGRLMTAISGGAVMPFLSGLIADHFGIRGAFLLPVLSYLFIAVVAARCSSQYINIAGRVQVIRSATPASK